MAFTLQSDVNIIGGVQGSGGNRLNRDTEGDLSTFTKVTGSGHADAYWGNRTFAILSHIVYDPQGFLVTHHNTGITERVYRVRAQAYPHMTGNVADDQPTPNSDTWLGFIYYHKPAAYGSKDGGGIGDIHIGGGEVPGPPGNAQPLSFHMETDGGAYHYGGYTAPNTTTKHSFNLPGFAFNRHWVIVVRTTCTGSGGTIRTRIYHQPASGPYTNVLDKTEGAFWSTSLKNNPKLGNYYAGWGPNNVPSDRTRDVYICNILQARVTQTQDLAWAMGQLTDGQTGGTTPPPPPPTPPQTPISNVPGGGASTSYVGSKTVTLAAPATSSTPAASQIRYTLDNTSPKVSTNPILVSVNAGSTPPYGTTFAITNVGLTHLIADATVGSGSTFAASATNFVAHITITAPTTAPAAPSIAPSTVSQSAPFDCIITAPANSIIIYTDDDSGDPATSATAKTSTTNVETVRISATTVVRAYSHNGIRSVAYAQQSYTLPTAPDAPQFTPAGPHTFSTASVVVTITPPAGVTSCYYTTSGVRPPADRASTTPTGTNRLGSSAFTVTLNDTTTLRADCNINGIYSAVMTGLYTKSTSTSIAAPTATPSTPFEFAASEAPIMVTLEYIEN